MDSFEDVRQLSSRNLGLIMARSTPDASLESLADEPSTRSGLKRTTRHEIREYLPEYLKLAEALMLNSGRADHADGVARTYDLLCTSLPLDTTVPKQTESTRSKVSILSSQLEVVSHILETLETTIRMSSSSLTSVVGKYPMHGLLASLRCEYSPAVISFGG